MLNLGNNKITQEKASLVGMISIIKVLTKQKKAQKKNQVQTKANQNKNQSQNPNKNQK